MGEGVPEPGVLQAVGRWVLEVLEVSGAIRGPGHGGERAPCPPARLFSAVCPHFRALWSLLCLHWLCLDVSEHAEVPS